MRGAFFKYWSKDSRERKKYCLPSVSISVVPRKLVKCTTLAEADGRMAKR